MKLRHFLTLKDLSKSELLQVISKASEFKDAHHNNLQSKVLDGKVLAMIFEKSSTRTRVSFEAGISHLGRLWDFFGMLLGVSWAPLGHLLDAPCLKL